MPEFDQSPESYHTVLFLGKVVAETAKAYRFLPDKSSTALWLPKSQCTWDELAGKMWIAGWLVAERQLSQDST